MILCRCQAYLEQLVTKHPDIVTRESLGKTIQGRQLDMVTITQPEEAGEVMEREVKKRTILVMSRQQPGESPASYVVQGRLGLGSDNNTLLLCQPPHHLYSRQV